MANSQFTSRVQAEGQPPEWLPSTCATARYCWFHYSTSVFHWQSLPILAGQNVFTASQPFTRTPYNNTGQPFPFHVGNGRAFSILTGRAGGLTMI